MSRRSALLPLALLLFAGCPAADEAAPVGQTAPGASAGRLSPAGGAALSALIPATVTPGLPPAGAAAPLDDHGDDLAGASALVLGDPASGVLETLADRDAFLVPLAAGTTYALSLHAMGHAEVRLLRDGQEVARGTSASPLRHRPASAGLFVVEVGASSAIGLPYAVEVDSTGG